MGGGTFREQVLFCFVCLSSAWCYSIASRIPPGRVLRSRVLLFGVVAGLAYLVVLVFLVRVLCCRRRGRVSRVSRLAR